MSRTTIIIIGNCYSGSRSTLNESEFLLAWSRYFRWWRSEIFSLEFTELFPLEFTESLIFEVALVWCIVFIFWLRFHWFAWKIDLNWSLEYRIDDTMRFFVYENLELHGFSLERCNWWYSLIIWFSKFNPGLCCNLFAQK